MTAKTIAKTAANSELKTTQKEDENDAVHQIQKR